MERNPTHKRPQYHAFAFTRTEERTDPNPNVRHERIARSFRIDPPARLKIKAPTSFQPAQRSRSEIMAAFRAYQVQFVDRLRQASGLDLRRAKVHSPTSTWIRMSLNSGFALMCAHERRHLWQAQRVIAAAGFPH